MATCLVTHRCHGDMFGDTQDGPGGDIIHIIEPPVITTTIMMNHNIDEEFPPPAPPTTRYIPASVCGRRAGILHCQVPGRQEQ